MSQEIIKNYNIKAIYDDKFYANKIVSNKLTGLYYQIFSKDYVKSKNR